MWCREVLAWHSQHICPCRTVHSKHLEHGYLQISALPTHMTLAGLLWVYFSLVQLNCCHCQLMDLPGTLPAAHPAALGAAAPPCPPTPYTAQACIWPSPNSAKGRNSSWFLTPDL